MTVTVRSRLTPRGQVCGTLVVAVAGTNTTLCDACKQAQPDVAALVLHGRVAKLETQVAKLHSIWCAID
jgi:hypothetical protein